MSAGARSFRSRRFLPRRLGARLAAPRPPTPQATAPAAAIEPRYEVVSVRTNGVSLRAATSNAIPHTAWILLGAFDLGFWLESEPPFFCEGTNPVHRTYVSSGGTVSLGSMRRPPVGTPCRMASAARPRRSVDRDDGGTLRAGPADARPPAVRAVGSRGRAAEPGVLTARPPCRTMAA